MCVITSQRESKGKEKIRKLKEEVDELELLVEQEETEVKNDEEGDTEEDSSEKSSKTKLKEKTSMLMGGRASNDRKWKDSQVAFANILKVSTIPGSS